MTNNLPASPQPAGHPHPLTRLLTVENVSFSVRGRCILDAVSLQVSAGEIVTLIGPNGAGKSTLVRSVLGLLRPDAGRIQLQSGIRIGYMPQRLHIDHSLPLSVRRFITLGTHASQQQVQALLHEVGAAHILNAPLQAISGGECQRMLLARALLREPQLLVLDEPMQGVDLNGQYELYDLIGKLRGERGCGILMISHDLHFVMVTTDQVVCLNRHVCCSGRPDQVATHPAYQELFGLDITKRLAVYQHHHSHRHNLSGDIVALQDATHG